MVTSKISFWQIIRLVFVAFSLYLLGDAFYRWDGFSYHSTFYEFLPSIALAVIIWSIIAILTAIVLWILLRIFESFCLRAGYETRAEHLLIFTGFLITSGILVWNAKRLLWPLVQTGEQTKLIVLIGVLLASICFTWVFREKAEIWMRVINERITPLVWLFCTFVLLSIPIVSYLTWFKSIENVASESIARPFSAKDESRPNIILVTFDALAARNMSIYGYQRETTPFISKWSKEASIFNRLEAESNFTGPTCASLMTGKRVWTHQKFDPHKYGAKPVRSGIENLALELKNNGYYNMAFVQNRIATVKALGISSSFDIAPPFGQFYEPLTLSTFINHWLYQLFGNNIRFSDWVIRSDFLLGKIIAMLPGHIYETEFPTQKVFDNFFSVINNDIKEPFFVWIHLLPPHEPYLAPEPFMGIFDKSSKLRTHYDFDQLRSSMFDNSINQADISTFRARYDEFIMYIDHTFQYFIDGLEAREMEDSIVILSSDHGESFDHNYLRHGGSFLYEEVTHIPLVIKTPGQKKGQIIDSLVEQIDIPATILDLANISVPMWMEGRSLLPLLRGEELSPIPIFSMNLEENPSRGSQIEKGSIAVWEGEYKLIHYLEKKKSLLFNLKKDPYELENLINVEPEVGNHLLSLIYENLKKANERIRSGESY